VAVSEFDSIRLIFRIVSPLACYWMTQEEAHPLTKILVDASKAKAPGLLRVQFGTTKVVPLQTDP